MVNHHLTLYECLMTPLPLFTLQCAAGFPSCATPLIVFFSRALFVFGLRGALSKSSMLIFIIIILLSRL